MMSYFQLHMWPAVANFTKAKAIKNRIINCV